MADTAKQRSRLEYPREREGVEGNILASVGGLLPSFKRTLPDKIGTNPT
jgi:hypothetical protein